MTNQEIDEYYDIKHQELQLRKNKKMSELCPIVSPTFKTDEPVFFNIYLFYDYFCFNMCLTTNCCSNDHVYSTSESVVLDRELQNTWLLVTVLPSTSCFLVLSHLLDEN